MGLATDHAHLNSTALLACPYGCNLQDLREHAPDHTSKTQCCDRQVWCCTECHSLNRMLAQFCRGCGKRRSIPEVWPQWGRDSGGSFVSHQVHRISRLMKMWTDPEVAINTSTNDDLEQGLPVPILAGDLLVYYEPASRTFKARTLGGAQTVQAGGLVENSSRIVWTTDPFEQPLTRLSSPVQDGPFVYFVTASPHYLHRIALDSGHREICSFRIGQEIFAELPVDTATLPAPLLIPAGEAPGVNHAGGMLVMLSGEYLLIIMLNNDSVHGQVQFESHLFTLRAAKSLWHRPIWAGNHLIVISRQGGLINIASLDLLLKGKYPIKPRLTWGSEKLEGGFDWEFGQAMVLSATQEVCLCARAKDDPQMRVLRFAVTNTEQPQIHALHDLGQFWGEGGEEFQPLTDGAKVFMPGVNTEGRIGLSVVYPTRVDFHPMDRGAFNPLNGLMLGLDKMLLARNDRPVLFNPYAEQIAFETQVPYRSAQEHCQVIGRPIIGLGCVIIQGLDFISCYKVMS